LEDIITERAEFDLLDQIEDFACSSGFLKFPQTQREVGDPLLFTQLETNLNPEYYFIDFFEGDVLEILLLLRVIIGDFSL